MPELPDVEVFRRRAERSAVGHRILNIQATDDERVFCGTSASDLEKKLKGARIVSTGRRGKHMWLGMDGFYLMIHFGMTGDLVVEGQEHQDYGAPESDNGQDDDEPQKWPPRFWRLWFELDDGQRIAYSDARRFGKVRTSNDPMEEPDIQQLGWDPLLDKADTEKLVEQITSHRRPIKSTLLDQSIFAGVGNWVADEILFHCRLHPEQPGNDLTPAQCEALVNQAIHICQTACAADGVSSAYPKDWIFHARKKGKKIQMLDGRTVEHVKVGGRTSAFVPAVQPLDKRGTKREKKGESPGAKRTKRGTVAS